MPAFSFIVPCLNAEQTLDACLQSIRALEAEVVTIEILVVDNGSTDRSVEIAEQYANQVYQEPTATIAGLRNIGAAHARHEILVFVDSDCLLEPGWLIRCAAHFRQPRVAMVGSKTHRLPASAGWVAKAWKVHLDRSDLDPNPQWIVTRALAVRKSVFEEVGGFDEGLVTCEDVAFGHAVSKRYVIISDAALAPIHLKDADTLQELFTKELWRGKDSMATSTARLLSKPTALIGKEGISLLLPFYFSLAAAAILLGLAAILFGSSSKLFVVGVLTAGLPIVVLALNTCRKTAQYSWLPALVVVYAVYIASRTAGFYSSLVGHAAREHSTATCP